MLEFIKIILASSDYVHRIIGAMSSCTVTSHTHQVWRLMVTSWLIVSRSWSSASSYMLLHLIQVLPVMGIILRMLLTVYKSNSVYIIIRMMMIVFVPSHD